MDIREVRVDGRTIAVREWGRKDGMPFLFWHALGPGHSGSSARVAAGPLGAAGFRVLAVDAPGSGLSPRPADEDYALERLPALV